MSKVTINIIKTVAGVAMAATGTVLGYLGIRDLCFEKHEIGDLVQEATEEVEEEVL